jgi:hypothetical protein
LRVLDPQDNYRFKVNAGSCPMHAPPEVPSRVTAATDPDPKHSHEWGFLRFVEPASIRRIDHYEVRTSPTAITPDDLPSFMHGMPAVTASLDVVALTIPGGTAGNSVEVHFGGLIPVRDYWVAVRAVDECNLPGPFAVATLQTTRINFTKLSGCFIATAAYGSTLEPEVATLRTIRDALTARSPLFATVADLYYRSGPIPAQVIGRSDLARAAVRELLGPVVSIARAAEPWLSP